IPVDTAKPYWLLDPVDGTTNLIHSFRHSAISLGLVEEGRVTFGLVYQPYTHECFAAVRGKGAYCNGKRICVSKAEKLSQSLLSQIRLDRKSTRLNSSHVSISYAVFCLKKKIQASTMTSRRGSDIQRRGNIVRLA